MLNEFFNGAVDSPSPPAPTGIRSLRFNRDDSSYLECSSFGTPTDVEVYTVSLWIKKANGSSGLVQYILNLDGEGSLYMQSTSDGDRLRWAGSQNFHKPGREYDTAAWMHILLVQYNKNAREMFINGVSVNTISSDGELGSGGTWTIGGDGQGSNNFKGLIADIYYVDGQALSPVDFTVFDSNGDLQPKSYTGTFGNNGFHLPFSDNTNTTTIGQDSSGNGHNFTAFNISVTAGAGNDSLVDSPSKSGTDTGIGGEVFGNYATLDPYTLVNGGELSNGNLDAALTGASGLNSRDLVLATMLTESGKWYLEVQPVSSTNNTPSRLAVGIAGKDFNTDDFRYGSVHYRPYIGEIREDNNSLATGLPLTNAGDIIGVAYDLDASTFSIYVNGTLESTVSFTISGPFRPFIVNGDGSIQTIVASVNFGQRAFAYTAPSGYKAICSTNLADPTIIDSTEHVNTAVYTGDGSGSNAVTGLGFSPDLLWFKSRAGRAPYLVDAVRGGDKLINTSSGNVETTDSNAVQSFDADGFTVGSSSSFNNKSESIVSWAWHSSGSDVSNTDGSITSSVRADTTAGFSIVTYTGTGSSATVGHGLGAAPEMYIIKNRNDSTTPRLFTTAIDGSLDQIVLSSTNGKTDSAITLPTSTVFSLDSSTSINKWGGDEHIAYCWTSIPGFSQFGSFIGNGNNDGPLINLGFRPAVVYIKNSISNSVYRWYMTDNKRTGFNNSTYFIATNDSNAEITSTQTLWLLSHGFKVTTSNVAFNALGNAIFYAAWAEDPFKTALAR